MSNFTPLVEKEYDFDGDVVKVSFSRLRRQHMLAAMPAFKQFIDAKKDDDPDIIGDKESLSALNDVLDIIIDVIPEYIDKFEGLKDATGEPISIETVISDLYFMTLCAKIATDMMKESTIIGGN